MRVTEAIADQLAEDFWEFIMGCVDRDVQHIANPSEFKVTLLGQRARGRPRLKPAIGLTLQGRPLTPLVTGYD